MSNQHSLENYEFLKTIGKGTFGKVKLAIHKPTEEQVAIKILEKSKIKTKKDLERIEKEIKYLKIFNHPNIIKIYQIKEDNDNFYIVMEYVPGGELFKYIVSNRRLNENEASFFYSQIIHIIQEVHNHKICHRDIKPENLLLTLNKTIKLIDFGLSNEYEDLLETPCGSPCFASPEIIRGKKYSGIGIDIWASGIILFFMLCGYLPFDDKDNVVLFKKILRCKFDFPKNRKYNISDTAKDLIRKILTKEPKDRITLEEILEHPFLVYGNKKYKEKVNTEINKQDELIIEYMLNEMKMQYTYSFIKKNLTENKHNNITTTFNLLKKKYNEGRLNYNLIKHRIGNYFQDSEGNDKVIKRYEKNKIYRSLKVNKNNYIDNSFANDIGNIIKRKVYENKNNIIIINNNTNMDGQSQRMNYIFNSIFDRNKNNNINNEKIINIIDGNESFRKNDKAKDLNNRENLLNHSHSPNLHNYLSNGFKYNHKIKKKNYDKNNSKNSNIINNRTLDNESLNYNNRDSTNEKNISVNRPSKYRYRDIESPLINPLFEMQCHTLNNSCEYKNDRNTGIKNIESINKILYNQKESNNNNYDNILNRNKYINKGSPKYLRLFNYFNYCTEVPIKKSKKVKDINNLNTYSLINELNNSSKKNNNVIEGINEYKTINQENIIRGRYSLRANNSINNKINENEKKCFYEKINNKKKIIEIRKIPGFMRRVSNDIFKNNNLTERQRIPKSIYINKMNDAIEYSNNTENSNLKNITEKIEEKKNNKIFPYSRKICTVYNKPLNKNNYIMLSSNLTIRQISNIIIKYCDENELTLQKNQLKYIITHKKINSFIIDININEGCCVLKFMHKDGNVNETKQHMNKLFFEIAN